MENLIPLITGLTMLMPNAILWLIGIGLALARWQRHPRVSLLALIAFAVLLVTTTTGRVLSVWLPLALQERGWALVQIGSISALIGAVTTIINTLAWVLVLCAIFGWRAGQQNFAVPPPPSFAGAPPAPETTTGI